MQIVSKSYIGMTEEKIARIRLRARQYWHTRVESQEQKHNRKLRNRLYMKLYREIIRALPEDEKRKYVIRGKTSPEKMRTAKRKHNLKLRCEAIKYYSNGHNECASCGCNDFDVLCLDHIHDNGHQHRSLGNRKLYEEVKSLGYPSGFQVLCFNCNMKKEFLRRRNIAVNS